VGEGTGRFLPPSFQELKGKKGETYRKRMRVEEIGWGGKEWTFSKDRGTSKKQDTGTGTCQLPGTWGARSEEVKRGSLRAGED